MRFFLDQMIDSSIATGLRETGCDVECAANAGMARADDLEILGYCIRPETCGMRSGRVRLAPGESIGRHNTKVDEKLLVFLSGRGVARIGMDIPLQVEAGETAYIPPQTAHDIVNTGTEPLTYVFCAAPASWDRRGLAADRHGN